MTRPVQQVNGVSQEMDDVTYAQYLVDIAASAAAQQAADAAVARAERDRLGAAANADAIARRQASQLAIMQRRIRALEQ